MEVAVQAEPDAPLPMIGYIGLGRMGGPMADNLLRKGFPLCIHDISDSAAAGRVDAGARRCASAAELAEVCDIVFTCLPGPVEARQVYLGDTGLAAGAKPGAIFIECTTGAPELIDAVQARLQARGASLIEACVSGGPENSRAGTLVLMLGGAAAEIERARPGSIMSAISEPERLPSWFTIWSSTPRSRLRSKRWHWRRRPGSIPSRCSIS
jgi:3-hydroxyisobutyrate dehydrogenase-like beta-hydroxyacid dehydrogenase